MGGVGLAMYPLPYRGRRGLSIPRASKYRRYIPNKQSTWIPQVSEGLIVVEVSVIHMEVSPRHKV